MMKYIYIFICFFIISCHSIDDKLIVDIEIPLEQAYVEIYHTVSGDKIYSSFYEDLNGKQLSIESLPEDMYTICLVWERTFVPHKLFKRKEGKIVFDIDNKFYLIKDIYLNRNQDNRIKLRLNEVLSKEDMETANYYQDVLDVISTSEDLALSLVYEHVYEEADSLNETQHKIWSRNLIDYIAKNNWDEARKVNILLKSDSLDRFKSEFVNMKFNSLAVSNTESPVSTYYIFKDLLANRNFNDFRKAFFLLEGRAKLSPYYRMVKNQYDNID
ncbi:hypothetical protein [Sphingobacterium bovistauri]|uniref:DUF4369 domain-containing protein n=1 Tax=Sphingobacterium bovistauri TaxID=2781959 RepID=A0ABS7Z420_9SPHI|nr:hypothetical protein [Sphingobacterium bovistauri]MCA5004302.1 hypothetical protein [Sphingobacterium bovistauri]